MTNEEFFGWLDLEDPFYSVENGYLDERLADRIEDKTLKNLVRKFIAEADLAIETLNKIQRFNNG